MCAIISIYLHSDRSGLTRSVFPAKLEQSFMRRILCVLFIFIPPAPSLLCSGYREIFHVCWLSWARFSLSLSLPCTLVSSTGLLRKHRTCPVTALREDRLCWSEDRQPPKCHFSFVKQIITLLLMLPLEWTMFTISQTQRPARARKEIQWCEAGQVRTVVSRQVCALTGEDSSRLVPTHDCRKRFLVWCRHTFGSFRRNQMFIGHLPLFKYLWQAQKV